MLGLLGEGCFAERGTGGCGQGSLFEGLVSATLPAAPHGSLAAFEMLDVATSAQKGLQTSQSFAIDLRHPCNTVESK